MPEQYINSVGTGFKPFNFEQVNYTLKTHSGKVLDFQGVVTAVSIDRAYGLEKEIIALEAVLRQRIRKIEILGNILADATRLDNSLEKITDTGTLPNAERDRYYAQLYHVEYADRIGSDGKMSRGDAQQLCAALEKNINLEDNDLQQDTVTMNSYLNKRDEAFQMAAKLTKNISDSRTKNIRNI